MSSQRITGQRGGHNVMLGMKLPYSLKSYYTRGWETWDDYNAHSGFKKIDFDKILGILGEVPLSKIHEDDVHNEKEFLKRWDTEGTKKLLQKVKI